jgi:hypothetical protein
MARSTSSFAPGIRKWYSKGVKRLALLCVLIACAAPAFAGNTPPPIDAAALAAYAHGSGTISGSTGFGGAVQAFCAPDIPYVVWYVERRKLSPNDDYDSRLTPYVHRAQLAKDRTFTCEGLASGRYLVWVEGYAPDFRRPPSSYSRQREDPISGQVDPYYYTVTWTGANQPGPDLILVGPERVTVAGAGTANVRL